MTLTQRIEELTEVLADQAGQLAELKEQIRELAVSKFCAETFYDAGYADAQKAIYNHAAKASQHGRPPGKRAASHLTLA